jgi:hypothetical protein
MEQHSMTTRTDYTEDEWKTLLDLPRLAAFGAMAAEEGGPLTSTRELFAAIHTMADSARTAYPDNTLIHEIVTEITQGGDDALGTRVAWEPGDENLGAAMLDQALATAARARNILAARATAQEASEYAAWVLSIARAGCGAAGSGFLGLVGDRVTPSEARFVADLAAALGAA